MAKALVLKELREIAWIAALALAAYLLLVARATGWSEEWPRFLYGIPGFSSFARRTAGGQIPFVGDFFTSDFATVSALLAVALGFRQTVGESLRGTWPLLLRLPISRERVVRSKLVAGLAAYLGCAAIPLLLYSVWAATPGTHASPFAWSMTIPAWQVWLVLGLLYLGAFLSGLRQARWVGSRLLPLAGLAIPVIVLQEAVASLWIAAGLTLLLAAVLLAAIQHVARTRDYS